MTATVPHKKYCTSTVEVYDYRGVYVMVLGCDRPPHAKGKHRVNMTGKETLLQRETVVFISWEDPK